MSVVYVAIRFNFERAKTNVFLLFFALTTACLVLFVKFFYFKNRTIAWFVLVLAQLCVIIYLYMAGIVNDLLWPILFFVPATANIIVFFHGEGISRYLTSVLIDMGICAQMYSKGVLSLLWSLLLLFGLLLLSYALEKIYILLKRRYYGKV